MSNQVGPVPSSTDVPVFDREACDFANAVRESGGTPLERFFAIGLRMALPLLFTVLTVAFWLEPYGIPPILVLGLGAAAMLGAVLYALLRLER